MAPKCKLNKEPCGKSKECEWIVGKGCFSKIKSPNVKTTKAKKQLENRSSVCKLKKDACNAHPLCNWIVGTGCVDGIVTKPPSKDDTHFSSMPHEVTQLISKRLAAIDLARLKTTNKENYQVLKNEKIVHADQDYVNLVLRPYVKSTIVAINTVKSFMIKHKRGMIKTHHDKDYGHIDGVFVYAESTVNKAIRDNNYAFLNKHKSAIGAMQPTPGDFKAFQKNIASIVENALFVERTHDIITLDKLDRIKSRTLLEAHVRDHTYNFCEHIITSYMKSVDLD
jgi:hypothetical protein